MTTFRWLHLTDLHFGMSGQASLWPNMEEIFLKDLAILHEQVGPWDMVLSTGDLTQSGGKSEFDELDRLLQRFWDRFKELGFTPEFFAVPGNHDLIRPANTSNPALITLLHTWSLPAVQTPFWEDAATLQLSYPARPHTKSDFIAFPLQFAEGIPVFAFLSHFAPGFETKERGPLKTTAFIAATLRKH